MANQLRLPLAKDPAYRRDDFVVSPANAEAKRILCAWRTWPGRAAALIGPEGSGKTHLARMWSEEAAAIQLTSTPADFSVLQGKNLLIEDADAWKDEGALFHLINMVQASGALLLTSRRPPIEWTANLPDLRSRLNALQVAELAPPDDEALAGVLRSLFAQRNIVPADDLLPYLLLRMERSFDAAQRTVALLDEAAAAKGREVNRSLAMQTPEIAAVINDLFG